MYLYEFLVQNDFVSFDVSAVYAYGLYTLFQAWIHHHPCTVGTWDSGWWSDWSPFPFSSLCSSAMWVSRADGIWAGLWRWLTRASWSAVLEPSLLWQGAVCVLAAGGRAGSEPWQRCVGRADVFCAWVKPLPVMFVAYPGNYIIWGIIYRMDTVRHTAACCGRCLLVVRSCRFRCYR